MTDRPPLTTRQARILHVIQDTVEQRGYPPSLREIGEAVGLASSSSVGHQLQILQARGYITRDQNRPRALTIIDPEPELITIDHLLRTLARTYLDGTHGKQAACPADGENLGAVGITELAYTFEVCACGTPEYSHLVEQLWHRACLARTEGTT